MVVDFLEHDKITMTQIEPMALQKFLSALATFWGTRNLVL